MGQEPLEPIAKLLYTYGPAGLLVVVLTIIERRARGLFTANVPKSLTVSVYGAVWVLIFVLSGFIIHVFYHLNVDREYVLRGKIEGLQASEEINSTDAMFLRPHRDGADRRWYEFLIITPEQLKEGEQIKFYVDTPREDESLQAVLRFRPEYYQEELRIQVERDPRSVMLLAGHVRLRLDQGSAPLLLTTQAPARPFLSWTVHAASSPSIGSNLARLESRDPVVRRYARGELANRPPREAIPAVNRVLMDRASSPLLKLGVIVALNSMKSVDGLTPAAYTAIVKLQSHPDSLTRSQAQQFVKSHRRLAAQFRR